MTRSLRQQEDRNSMCEETDQQRDQHLLRYPIRHPKSFDTRPEWETLKKTHHKVHQYAILKLSSKCT
jgi:hypothetical protein